MTLQLQNSKNVPGRWLFNPMVTPSKNYASNLQFAKNHQNPPNRATLHLYPLEEIPIHPNLPAPLPAAPEQLVASKSRDGAQKIGEGWEEEGGAAAIRRVDTQ
jgi:hypothetical protein